MPQVTNDRLDILQDDLQTTDQNRYENLQALAWLLAENRLLKSVLVGISPKPLEQILREGKGMIEEGFRDLQENRFEKLEGLIDNMVRRQNYGGV